jgi:hypothetical protein
MATEEQLKSQFEQLLRESDVIRNIRQETDAAEKWSAWSTAVLHLLAITFGEKSPYHNFFQKACLEFRWNGDQSEQALGIFRAAKRAFDAGLFQEIKVGIAGEILGDFVKLAKVSLAEKHKDVAAVLACAALEDALKRFAQIKGIDVSEKTMDSIVGALKSDGFVQGAQKSLLDVMPRIRNYAMHADWTKISETDVGSVIGFVETFLQTKFS